LPRGTGLLMHHEIHSAVPRGGPLRDPPPIARRCLGLVGDCCWGWIAWLADDLGSPTLGASGAQRHEQSRDGKWPHVHRTQPVEARFPHATAVLADATEPLLPPATAT
jgi:hypothetical protein